MKVPSRRPFHLFPTAITSQIGAADPGRYLVKKFIAETLI
jgi:hypothetical protein